MMRIAVSLSALSLLAACASETSTTYTCANGPDLQATYADGSVTLLFANGRVETLRNSDPTRPFVYSNARAKWSDAGLNARLDMDQRSLLCDALS